MPETPSYIPGTLSGRLATTASSVLTLQGREVDVAIGGIPFRLATSQELPQSIETIPIQKAQFDAETEPGEQSLAFWWRRSQDSWHEGAGNLYQEPRGANISPSAGFYESQGMDVWTAGQMTLLRRMVQDVGTLNRIYSGTVISAVRSDALIQIATPGAAHTVVHSAPAGETYVDGFVLAGGNFYGLLDNGTLYEGTVASPGTASSWPLNGTVSRMAFGQHRIWVIGGRDIWQPNLGDVAGTAQTPIYTNPNKAWTYTCLAEGPSAMYFGGHDGSRSTIQAITLDDAGGIPTLSGATVVVQLPSGELVQEIEVLAGQFLGIGTNRGFRVGLLSGDSVTYGPLLFEPDSVDSCTAIAASGRFFLVSFSAGGVADAYKIDTGTQIEDGVFPYAKDIECGAGFIKDLAVWDEQVLAVDSAGVFWYQHESELVSSGSLTTGRIRFRTTEKKLFKNLQLETEPLTGSLSIEGFDQSGVVYSIGTLDTAGDTGEDTIQLPTSLGPQRQTSLKFTLNRDTVDLTSGPIIHSYVIQALPVVTPQRKIVLPLLCFDKEKAYSGQKYGYDGFADDRHATLQNLENNSDVVTYQSFGRINTTGQNVLIDSIRFVQTTPPTGLSGISGHGGILLVTLRTVNL